MKMQTGTDRRREREAAKTAANRLFYVGLPPIQSVEPSRQVQRRMDRTAHLVKTKHKDGSLRWTER